AAGRPVGDCRAAEEGVRSGPKVGVANAGLSAGLDGIVQFGAVAALGAGHRPGAQAGQLCRVVGDGVVVPLLAVEVRVYRSAVAVDEVSESVDAAGPGRTVGRDAPEVAAVAED